MPGFKGGAAISRAAFPFSVDNSLPYIVWY
jgi:hypothetical protein